MAMPKTISTIFQNLHENLNLTRNISKFKLKWYIIFFLHYCEVVLSFPEVGRLYIKVSFNRHWCVSGVFFTVLRYKKYFNKNKLRTFWGWDLLKNKHIEPQADFPGSYKKECMC